MALHGHSGFGGGFGGFSMYRLARLGMYGGYGRYGRYGRRPMGPVARWMDSYQHRLPKWLCRELDTLCPDEEYNRVNPQTRVYRHLRALAADRDLMREQGYAMVAAVPLHHPAFGLRLFGFELGVPMPAWLNRLTSFFGRPHYVAFYVPRTSGAPGAYRPQPQPFPHPHPAPLTRPATRTPAPAARPYVPQPAAHVPAPAAPAPAPTSVPAGAPVNVRPRALLAPDVAQQTISALMNLWPGALDEREARAILASTPDLLPTDTTQDATAKALRHVQAQRSGAPSRHHNG